jgi:type IV secretory pathway VirB2 component (pilin)
MDSNTTYKLLAPIANMPADFNVASSCPFGTYLGTVINITLGIIALLAFLMIVLGGIQYMTGELISNKQEGKDRILNSIWGLLIALGAWLILNTINPKLLEICLKLAPTGN